jgi:hypothetical protein
MEAWKRLRNVWTALKALNKVLVIGGLVLGAIISRPIVPTGNVPLLKVFVTTAPLTLAFAAITFVLVESSRIRPDLQLENSPLAVYGGSTVILFVAVAIGQSLGYAEVQLPENYMNPPSAMPLVYWIGYILFFPLALLGGVMLAYGVGVVLVSLVFGVALGGAMLYVLGHLPSLP